VSNSKSEDTLACGYCGMPMTSAGHLTLHIGMAHPPIKAILPEPPQDTCGCLCHNPDALKWGCEHCAMPPQDATIHDVVNGTPKGQEAVQKAIDDSIKVQNEMTKKTQDTSLDEQLMEVMLYVRTTHEVEHNDNQWTREFVFSFDEAKAKINRLIVESKLEAIDLLYWKYKELNGQSVDIKFAEAYGIITKELGDSEAEKNSGTWSRL